VSSLAYVQKKHAEGVTPAAVASLSASQMREIGISGRKASYLHDLANHFVTGALSDDIIQQMDEETLMAALTAVKGIGVWSVHMFMIFWLHKSDVLPVGDLGVRKGFQKLYQLEALPSVSQMTEIAASWRPFRSLGAWYLWRLNDNSRPFPPLS
jgi:DNA-3-methyladenine glycosylase II